jgi:hypothetical protein
MTVEALPQYGMDTGIPSFQWNVQNASGKERLEIRSKKTRQKKTEFIRVKSLDRGDRTSTTRTSKNDPIIRHVRSFVLIHTTVPSWYK